VVVDTYEISPSRQTAPPVRRLYAIEMFWHTGGRTLYGLLGAELESTPGTELKVAIAQHATAGECYVDSIAHCSDDVRKGLPAEYVRGVQRAVQLQRELLSMMGAGTLSFNRAAHGVAGSSIRVFEALTSAVLRLFTAEDPVDDSSLVDLLRRRLFTDPVSSLGES
jgi:hypothetical protein